MAEENKDENNKLEPQPKNVKPSDEDQELISQLPPEVRENIKFHLSSFRAGGYPNPLVEKLTPEHIAEIISNDRQEDQNRYKYAWSSRFFRAFYVLMTLACLIFLIIFLKDNDSALLIKIIEYVIVFCGGLGAGIGYGKNFMRD